MDRGDRLLVAICLIWAAAKMFLNIGEEPPLRIIPQLLADVMMGMTGSYLLYLASVVGNPANG